MRVRVLTSPFAGDIGVGEALTDHLADRSLDELTIVVAWARRSGLARIGDSIREFRARGGRTQVIVGIDEGGATLEGLELIRELSDNAWVFHDPQGGTFHPKVYLIRGKSTAVVIVGSANLTRGGLYANYEVSLELSLDLTRDHEILEGITSWMAGLTEDSEVCLELNDPLLGKILESGSARKEDDREDDTTDDRERPAVLLPFGRSRRKKATPPKLARPSGRAAQAPSGQAATAPAAAAAAIEDRWFKQLPMSDAQRAVGNVTGELRLTKSVLDIDWRTFFRRRMFAGAAWRIRVVNGQPGEEATVSFEVTIDGTYLGARDLLISHAPHREQGQSNYTTVLHWGSLNPALRARDFTRYWVVIGRTSDGRFQLSIQRDRPS